MAILFNFLDIGIDIFSADIKHPDKTDKTDFYKIYSPETFKLEPRKDIYLDLKFQINISSKAVEPWINLLPSLKGFRLYLEDLDWCSNRSKNSTIILNLINKSFTRTFEIKKDQKNCNNFFTR